jgi:hypothetical protein
MLGSRDGMPSDEDKPTDMGKGPSVQPTPDARSTRPTRGRLKRKFLHRIRHFFLPRQHDQRVRVLRHQTAELWMVTNSTGGRPQPMVYVCPVCSEKEDTRLLSVELRTEPRRFPSRLRHTQKPENRPRILLRITRQQLEDIRADFDSTPHSPRRFRCSPDTRTQREIVLDSLVP